MMKNYTLTLMFFLALVGCAKTQLTESPPESTPAMKQEPAPVVNSGVGTEGGGGTLVFAFRQGALAAKRAMEQNTEIGNKDPMRDELTIFYRTYRERWMKALEHFVFDAEMVVETSETLMEDGILVGAKSLPAHAPKTVKLSVPYLSGREGFTLSKAFALAVHEAGHFAKPEISQAEHPYLDQIANLLFWQRSSVAQSREYRLNFDFWMNRGSMLTTDGSSLMMINPQNALMTLDIESGLKMVEKDSHIAGQNWVYQQKDAAVKLRNQITREQISLTVPESYTFSGVLSDDRTLVLTKNVPESKAGSILIRDLRTGEERAVDTMSKTHFGSSFSEGYKMEVHRGRYGVTFFDLTNQEVLDFVQFGEGRHASPFGSFFISNKLALVWWYHSGPDFTYDLRKIGEKTIARISANAYLGKVKGGKQLAFTRPEHGYDKDAGILFYDLDSGTESVVSVPGLDKVERFGNQTKVVIEKRDSSLWLTDLEDPSKLERLTQEDVLEELHGAYSTVEGRVVVTQEYDTKTLIVRYLDRK